MNKAAIIIRMKLKVTLVLALFAIACNNDNSPDVSAIPVNLTLHRFDAFLFEKIDTLNTNHAIDTLKKTFPFFANDFFGNILGIPIEEEMAIDSPGYRNGNELKRFIRITRPLYDSISPRFEKTGKLQQDLKKAFQHVKYYFPAYKIPNVVMYIGPFDAPAIAITSEALAIGLQLYGGKNLSFYTSRMGQEMYPAYISRRFEPEYIPANAMSAVAEDLFQDKTAGRTLIEQIIIKGKQWWLVDKFLPGFADSLKTGYTAKQNEWCNNNEGVIWNFFLQNDLYTTDPNFIKNYIGEAPTTEGMPQSAPGNIGQWVGWQIVKAYAANHPELQPDAIMKADARLLFKESKYKPR